MEPLDFFEPQTAIRAQPFALVREIFKSELLIDHLKVVKLEIDFFTIQLDLSLARAIIVRPD
jgi:hypothetical protein